MVDSNFYVENPANMSMHYGDKPLVGVLDVPDKSHVKRPYNYFEAQSLYNSLQVDSWEKQQHANPENAKKGIPMIIKIAIGALIAAPIIFFGVRKIQKIIAKFKH